MEKQRTYKFTEQSELIQKVVNLYKSGLSTYKIGMIVGKSRSTISLYLKHANINTKRKPERKYEFNENFFDKIDSHVKAYWLGFLLADGCLAKRSVILQLAVKDRDHLVRLLNDVESHSPIKHCWKSDGKSKEKKHEAVSISLCSSYMRSKLLSLGWEEFKKFGDVKILNSVPKNLKPSLMRGLFDGDGSSMPNRMTFTDAHLEPVVWFQESLVEELKIKRYPIAVVRNGVAFTLRLSGQTRLKSIRKFLYGSPGPRLKRKEL